VSPLAGGRVRLPRGVVYLRASPACPWGRVRARASEVRLGVGEAAAGPGAPADWMISWVGIKPMRLGSGNLRDHSEKLYSEFGSATKAGPYKGATRDTCTEHARQS
jgi:hypothetical protein